MGRGDVLVRLPVRGDVAVIAQAGHHGAGRPDQADGHADGGGLVVIIRPRQERDAVADVADDEGPQRHGDDRRVWAVTKQLFRLVDDLGDRIHALLLPFRYRGW